ncbi:transglutaminase domain-containing protein [Sorangium sp. So ce1000]|uniref:transglutaminase domain-containing protein n=1 Tax=Sorangium sp. So ce1000 TaxID=3133325 RepID=UPI003F60F2DB
MERSSPGGDRRDRRGRDRRAGRALRRGGWLAALLAISVAPDVGNAQAPRAGGAKAGASAPAAGDAKAGASAPAAGSAKAGASAPAAGNAKAGASAPAAGSAQAPRAGGAKASASAPAAGSAPASEKRAPVVQALRWTAATPDEMLGAALARARRGGDDAIAGLVIAAALADRAAQGRAREGLAQIGASPSPLADEARWLAASLAPEPPPAAWPGARAVSYDAPPDPSGLVKAFAILGPFQDNSGGGLARREGPEAEGQRFSDMSARYAWGVYDVAWRRVLPAASTARGVPLDLYIHPRAESCTYLASRVTVPAALDRKPILAHVAATGAVRLLWDGADVAASDAAHQRLALDRIAARIEAPAGDHLLALKVCTGAIADEGRVRVRFTDEERRPVALATSSDLTPLTLPPAAAPDVRAARPATAVATALDRALDAGASQSLDQALTAVVARTLGGADDQRSPRAPGLLDRVTRSPGISPDALALAGWVSPFGANRSGWLEAARARGLAEKDRATAAFAQRRLVAAHLASDRVDWAAAALREEPLRSARDPEARVLRALVKKKLAAASGFTRAGLEELLAVEREQKDRAPVVVWQEIAAAARLDPALGLRAARRLAEIAPESRGASYVLAFEPEGGAALEVAAAGALAQQTSADDVIRVGRALHDAGRAAWAREVLSYATQVAPNEPAAFQALAAVREGGEGGASARPEVAAAASRVATAALARARDLTPGDPFLKAELALRLGEGSAGAPGRRRMRDEEHIVAPGVFLSRARQTPAKKGEVADRQLHWVRVVTYHPDKRVSQLMHYAREIVIEPRTDQDLYERDIPAEGEDTELLFARVHRKDGTVAQPDEQGAGGQKPFVRWPELKAGDVVEVAVRSWTRGPVGRRGDAPFYFIDYVGSTDTRPILYNEVVVDSPTGDPLAIDVLNGKAERVLRSEKEGRQVTRYIWDDPPEVPEEPLAPHLAEVLPVVVGSTFHGWHDFREWYRGAVAGFMEPDDQVRRLAAELTKGKTTREDKLRALFDFVSDDIRYVNFVSGEWWLPNRPQELLARRQGDCDDKAMLLITLLKSIGIEATEVLVQTRYTGQPSLLRSEVAAIPVFDHGIAYLPGAGGAPGLWLDATSPQSRLGPLPAMDARTLSLFVDEGPPKIVETPASSPADHGVDAEWTVALLPSGAGELSAKERHIGDAAFELRSNLAEADARAQWVEQYLAYGWFPTVDVKPKVAFQADLPHGAATLEYEARSEGLARREGAELSVPLSGASTMTSQLAPLVKRTLPVVLPPSFAPRHHNRTITIVAPPGYTFAELPPGGDENGGAFGRATISFAKVPGKNAVVVKERVILDQSTIPVAQYEAWRGWLQRVDGLLHRMVRLVPVAPAEKKAR